MSLYGVGETYHYGLSTYNSSNALHNADSTPTGTLVVNGSDSAATVTVANTAPGRYSIAASLAGRSVGDDCFVRYSATVGGVTQEARTPPFRVAFPAALSGGVLTAGTGAAQINAASGKAPATLAATDVTGNVPADAKAINAVSTSAVTTVGANVGTAQPINFTGTGTSALIRADILDVAGQPASAYTGVAQGGSSTTIILANGETNYPVGREIVVGGYAVRCSAVSGWGGSTPTATIDGTWPNGYAPTSGSQYAINDLVPSVDTSGNVKVQGPFKINTASGFEVQVYQSDGVTPYTSAASNIAVTREVAGAGTTAAAGTLSQVGATNRYYFAGAAADFAGVSVAFTFSGSGIASQTVSINTTP